MQTMAFASASNGGIWPSGTGGTLAIAGVGSFTWSVPWCWAHGCAAPPLPPVFPGSCSSTITPEGGAIFAATLSAAWQGASDTSCSFVYELNNGNVAPMGQGLILPDQALSRGTSLSSVSSKDGWYQLQLQTDGNLVLTDTGVNPPHPIWATNSANTAASVALMQADGNFVLWDQYGNPVWASNTPNNPGAFLTVEDGFFTIHSSNGAALLNYGGDQDLYAAIWEKRASVPWVAKNDLTTEQYQQEFDTLRGQGYRPVVISGYNIFDQPLYAAIWEKRASVPWVAKNGLTAAQYQQEFDTLAGQGYRPVWVSGYGVAGQDFYAAIWEQRADVPWVAKHGMTAAQYQQQFDTLAAQGYRPVQVSGYSVAGQAFYAAIWEKSLLTVPWAAHHGMTAAQFQQLTNDLGAQGYRLVQMSGYSVQGQALYAAIWEQDSSVPWVARDGLTSTQYQQEFDNLASQGYRPTDVSGYSVP